MFSSTIHLRYKTFHKYFCDFHQIIGFVLWLFFLLFMQKKTFLRVCRNTLYVHRLTGLVLCRVMEYHKVLLQPRKKHLDILISLRNDIQVTLNRLPKLNFVTILIKKCFRQKNPKPFSYTIILRILQNFHLSYIIFDHFFLIYISDKIGNILISTNWASESRKSRDHNHTGIAES